MVSRSQRILDMAKKKWPENWDIDNYYKIQHRWGTRRLEYNTNQRIRGIPLLELENKNLSHSYMFRNYETADFKRDITHSDIAHCKQFFATKNKPVAHVAKNVKRTLFPAENSKGQISKTKRNSTNTDVESQTKSTENIFTLDTEDDQEGLYLLNNVGNIYTVDNLTGTENESENIEEILIPKDNSRGTTNRTEKNDTNTDKELESTKKSVSTKQNFCLFCKKLVSKIPRHYASVHKNEDSVKEFLDLPKGSHLRKLCLENLRKQGNFIHNTTNFKTDSLVTCRRTRNLSECNIKHFKPCPICKGFYSVKTLRKHVCSFGSKPENLFFESRRVHGLIHSKACSILKNKVFPVLRDDSITDAIRYDELAIIYGKNMCYKYRSPHHYSMIRTRLRLIGRFLIAMKTINPEILKFSSAFHPKNFDDVIKAINIVASLNEDTNTFAAPHTAFSLGTALKYTANLFITECIKNGDKLSSKNTKDFLKLIEQDLSAVINKTVTENALEQRRHKKIVLPTYDDIKKLNCYLTTNRRKFATYLTKDDFSYESWIKLASFTLISLQVFNRRRSGEMERALISDFNCRQKVNETTDPKVFTSLTQRAQEATKRYERFIIRGKLARNVAVLLHKELVDNIKIILNFRESAGVSKDNPYIFGIPGRNGKQNSYLRATKLLREYSVECGAANPATLRGTQLRKHIASQSVLLNLKENEVNDLATFLGHSTKIHKEHYQIPIVTRDIAQMSRILEMAQGTNDNNTDNDLQNEQENDEHINEGIINAGTHGNIALDHAESKEKNASTSQQIDLSHVSPINSEMSHCVEGGAKNITFEINVDSNYTSSSDDRLCNEEINEASSKIDSAEENLNQVKSRCNTAEVENIAHENNDNDSTKSYKRILIQEDSTDSESESGKRKSKEQKYSKLKRSTGYIARTTWNTPEKRVARNIFSDYIKQNQLPSFNFCAELITRYPELKRRTAMQLKLWVQNQITKNKKKILLQNSTSSRRSVKKCWTTPEKRVVREEFANHLENKTLPTYHECRQIKEKHDVLRSRSIQVIKAFVNNQLRREKC